MAGELSLYERAGGEDGIRRLVETFYDIVENEPEGEALNILHLRGHGVAHSRAEQFNFLSGFFGGPKIYAEKHGHSNVRKMHAHVAIDPAARDSWINCMEIAMSRVNFDPVCRDAMMRHFRLVATQLQNRD